MSYRVIISAPAERQFTQHYQWIAERSQQGAETWQTRMMVAIRSLSANPERHAEAKESVAYPMTIRCLLSGKNRGAFRILYAIQNDEVLIISIRRPAQNFASPSELDDL